MRILAKKKSNNSLKIEYTFISKYIHVAIIEMVLHSPITKLNLQCRQSDKNRH